MALFFPRIFDERENWERVPICRILAVYVSMILEIWKLAFENKKMESFSPHLFLNKKGKMVLCKECMNFNYDSKEELSQKLQTKTNQHVFLTIERIFYLFNQHWDIQHVVHYKICICPSNLTFWCLKKVLNEIHARPICWNAFTTLLADPPATRIAKQRSKFPAGVLVFVISGWLLQTLSLDGQVMLEQVVLTSTIVPTWRVVTKGPEVLHAGHIWNRSSSCERKTMYFGSDRKLLSALFLKYKNKGSEVN